MEIPPGLTHATTYVVVAQPTAVDRWHVLPDMTVIYERRSGEFEQARVLTAATLRDRPALDRTPPPTRNSSTRPRPPPRRDLNLSAASARLRLGGSTTGGDAWARRSSSRMRSTPAMRSGR